MLDVKNIKKLIKSQSVIESLAKIEKLGIWNDNIDDDVDNILIWSSIFTAILLSLFSILKNKLKNIFK